MKFTIPITLVVLTVLLMVAGLVWAGHAGGTVGIVAGSAMYGLTPKADTPEHALANLLADAQRRNWTAPTPMFRRRAMSTNLLSSRIDRLQRRSSVVLEP